MADDCVTKVAELLVKVCVAQTESVEYDPEDPDRIINQQFQSIGELAIRMTIAATHDEENHGITKSQSQYREQRLKQVESLVCARILQALEAEKKA